MRRGKPCHEVVATMYGTASAGWHLEVAQEAVVPSWMRDDPAFDWMKRPEVDKHAPGRGLKVVYLLRPLDEMETVGLWCEKCQDGSRHPRTDFDVERRGRPTPRSRPRWLPVPPNAEPPG
jgi:hypothetical protein